VDELLYKAKNHGRNRVEYNKQSPCSIIEASGIKEVDQPTVRTPLEGGVA
jgi:hypothetical protein